MPEMVKPEDLEEFMDEEFVVVALTVAAIIIVAFGISAVVSYVEVKEPAGNDTFAQSVTINGSGDFISAPWFDPGKPEYWNPANPYSPVSPISFWKIP